MSHEVHHNCKSMGTSHSTNGLDQRPNLRIPSMESVLLFMGTSQISHALYASFVAVQLHLRNSY